MGGGVVGNAEVEHDAGVCWLGFQRFRVVGDGLVETASGQGVAPQPHSGIGRGACAIQAVKKSASTIFSIVHLVTPVAPALPDGQVESLEAQPQDALDVSGGDAGGGAGDFAKVASADSCACAGELRRISQVERFSAELELKALHDAPVLCNREIEIARGAKADVGNPASRRADREGRGGGDGGGVEPTIRGGIVDRQDLQIGDVWAGDREAVG